MRILYLDPDPEWLKLVTATLTQMGHEVEPIQSKALADQYDLFFFDAVLCAGTIEEVGDGVRYAAKIDQIGPKYVPGFRARVLSCLKTISADDLKTTLQKLLTDKETT